MNKTYLFPRDVLEHEFYYRNLNDFVTFEENISKEFQECCYPSCKRVNDKLLLSNSDVHTAKNKYQSFL